MKIFLKGLGLFTATLIAFSFSIGLMYIALTSDSSLSTIVSYTLFLMYVREFIHLIKTIGELYNNHQKIINKD